MAGVFRHRPLGVTKNKSGTRGISALAPLMAAGFFRSFPATGPTIIIRAEVRQALSVYKDTEKLSGQGRDSNPHLQVRSLLITLCKATHRSEHG